MTSRGMARSGQVGIGKDWLGAELETVDRVLVTVPLRVLVVRRGMAGKGEAWPGRDGSGKEWFGEARANVAAMGLVTVSWSIQSVYQST